MCGIVLLYGPKAAQRLPGCLARLRHRGPDDQHAWLGDDVAFGFTRLAINGVGPSGRQPLRYGELIGAVNGEIYNHHQLRQDFALKLPECDTHVILPLLSLVGAQVIDLLDGFYSAVVLRPSALEVTTLRDHMGKKPLFVGGSGSEVFLASELKSLGLIDWFEVLPRGMAKVDLATGKVTPVAAHKPVATNSSLTELLATAVMKRLPSIDQPVGLFLSGGLDSSLIAAIASRLRDDVRFFTLGDPSDPDRTASDHVVASLGLRNVRRVPLPSSERIPELVRAVVFATESFNPSIVSNGLATMLLAEAAHEEGIKVVLTGEGADELFGGYHSFEEQDPWREVRAQLVEDMQTTELRRLDMACMAHSVEARCPFLDRAVRSFSDQLGYRDLYDAGERKVVLRRMFQGLLPGVVLQRPKTSFDVGSGIRRMVVRHLRRRGRTEREELMVIWRDCFPLDPVHPYFHSYPVFDTAIGQRGEGHR